VINPNQKLGVTQHNFGLRTLAKPFDNSKLDLSLYYRYGLDELRDFQDSIYINRDLEEKVLGANLDYFQRINSVSLRLFSSYESNSYQDKNQNIFNGITTYENNENLDVDIFNIGGIFSFYLFDDNFKASVFFKHNSPGKNYTSRTGKGIDLNYSLLNKLKFYLGISSYENYNSQDARSFEAGAMFNYYKLFIDFKYFDTDYNLYKPEIFYGPRTLEVIPTTNVKGLGLVLNYKFWMLLVETNTSYYFNHSRIIPEWQFVGGLYVNDLFFDDNLDLKAGLKFYYTGKINSYWQVGTNIEPTNKLDFTLAGEIKKVAIFYFIWENLFGNQYYITPYYPMPERNIRFGLAWELFN
ncbi:MAG: putative porin, partial [Chlorobium sp.]|nr:putative porin [Chlorobium sp.]